MNDQNNNNNNDQNNDNNSKQDTAMMMQSNQQPSRSVMMDSRDSPVRTLSPCHGPSYYFQDLLHPFPSDMDSNDGDCQMDEKQTASERKRSNIRNNHNHSQKPPMTQIFLKHDHFHERDKKNNNTASCRPPQNTTISDYCYGNYNSHDDASCSDLSHNDNMIVASRHESRPKLPHVTTLTTTTKTAASSIKHRRQPHALPSDQAIRLRNNDRNIHNRKILQIGPDFWVYLREQEETMMAFCTSGKKSLQVTTCSCCSERVACVRDAEFVKCPECHFTNLNGNRLCEEGGGLAVGIHLKHLKKQKRHM